MCILQQLLEFVRVKGSQVLQRQHLVCVFVCVCVRARSLSLSSLSFLSRSLSLSFSRSFSLARARALSLHVCLGSCHARGTSADNQL